MAEDLGAAYRAWLGDCVPSWSLLPRNLITVLVEADIGPGGSLRIDPSLTPAELDVIPAFDAARQLLVGIDQVESAPPDPTGELDPAFIDRLRGDRPHELMAYAVAVLGLLHLTHVRTEGIGLSAEGRALAASLREPGREAGPFFADFVAASLTTFNLGYLDELGVEGYPQSHVALVLYLLEQIAREPRSPAELARLASMPTDMPETMDEDVLTPAFEARMLRYLVWFDVMAREPDGRYRLTDKFDRLFTFDIPSVAMDDRPN